MTANQKLHEKTNHMRGLFLNRVSVIERLISSILTEGVSTGTPDDKLRRMPLARKSEILFKEIQEKVPHYWEDNKAHLEPLNGIITLRNCLAHSALDVSDEALARPLDQGVGFADWNNSKPLTDEEFTDYVVKTTMVYGCLRDVRIFFPRFEKSGPNVSIIAPQW